MNPAPDPPDSNNHMIIPEIYKSKPGFLTQTHNENQSNILTIILQKIENLEKRETNLTLPKRPPPEMCQAQPQEHNKFKKYPIIICTKFGAPKPFEKTSPQVACNTINKALMENCDNTPIRIKAFTCYPSGDIKPYTRSRAEACWLLQNRARWTH
ncbi:hypothetical protein O181_001981 [Austropuccinia psidii MF-1]|uniref:Uncharacterized protein n=1 Tax=Austropuccinia psidii MF-1 TaxID=1389203 RepID=A0A9Q3GCX0_9BASI|nr:hypothetical protein [Austropuccinia psidii MF-1]